MAIPRVCIVGGGPAGFYAAQHLLKHLPNSKVDVYEKLPIPFGLVRYGVAPDHPSVKNVIKQFTKTAQHPNFQFMGNVKFGVDVNLNDLRKAYHCVLLTYGAEQDRELNIPGENLKHVLSARRFVGWYNGVPDDKDLSPNLSGTTLTIVGQGNVAIDVARMILTPVDQLKTTDITEYALDALSESRIEQVHLVGRRGPLQAAFTIKELREMLKLPNCQTMWNSNDFNGVEALVPNLARPRKRITELMLKALQEQANTKELKEKQFLPKFFRSPVDISKSSVKFAKTKLKGDDGRNVNLQQALVTSDVEFLETDLVIRSIGYRAIPIDETVPFDNKMGVIRNDDGRVVSGVYTTGWLATGPTGVIVNTMSSACATADLICKDIITSKALEIAKIGSDYILDKLKQTNVQVVTWKHWEKIDKYEVEVGKSKGKPREKIVDILKMLKVAA